MRRAWFVAAMTGVAALGSSVPRSADAQVVFGYQLGLTQSVGTTLGDNLNVETARAQQNVAVEVDPTAPVANQNNTAQTAGLDVSALQGFQSNTQVNLNLTLDMVTQTFQHGLVIGGAVGQLIPFAVPEAELEGIDLNAQLRERITTVAANATYVAALRGPTWNFLLGGNYAFALNGRLGNGADGGVAGGAAGTLPAAQAGAFAFNGITHTAGGRTQLQINKQRWDLNFGANYLYTQNGIYTLAAGALGGQGGANAAGTNLGAFIPANLHTVTPTLITRARVGRRGLFTFDLNATYSAAERINDEFEVLPDGTTTPIPGPPAPPETVISNLRLEYAHQLGRDRTLGVDVNGTFSMRVATDAQGQVLAGSGLDPDTLIYTPRVFYRDALPWELRINLAVGAAQANLFQAPLGGGDPTAPFDTVRSNWTPVAALTLQRRFDPVDVTLTGTRNVGVGALGASAIVTEAGALTFQHVAELGERRLVTNLGFNANRTTGVDQQLFAGVDPNDPLVIAFNNYGFGVTAAMALPLLVADPFAIDANLTYNFNWVNTTPSLQEGENFYVPPLLTHVGLLTIRVVVGRGTAQNAAGVGGRVASDELDAFSANPATGSPLLTQRLLQQGAPVQQGNRPGEQAQGRRDSRQAYQQSIRQQEIEREARERAGALLGTGTAEEEERRALEEKKKKQEEAEEERSRDFGGWPTESISLPEEEPTPEEPPPPPPPKRRRSRRRR